MSRLLDLEDEVINLDRVEAIRFDDWDDRYSRKAADHIRKTFVDYLEER